MFIDSGKFLLFLEKTYSYEKRTRDELKVDIARDKWKKLIA